MGLKHAPYKDGKMYSNDIKSAIDSAKSDLQKMMDIALGTSDSVKDPHEEALKDKWLAAEGFRPVITPDKQIVWKPKVPEETSKIQNYQKALSSMSPETLVEVYPFLQHVINNMIPVVDGFIDDVKSGDMTLQRLLELTAAMGIDGLDEAIEKTGGMSAQGKGMLAKSSSAAMTAEILANNPKAVKEIGGVSNGESK